jgi:NAD(P)-dependent dehydrogenase (short-subunit alcohol dehydrogenase family)
MPTNTPDPKTLRTLLITGAGSGVGLALTEAVVAKGHAVIMAVRDTLRGAHARDELRTRFPSAQLRVERVDLTELDSVRALAQRVGEVDVLVNNAGIGFDPLRLTREGVVAQFAANHLGHFLLTALLFDQRGGRPLSRVVTVTSTLAKTGRLDLDNLDGRRGFRSATAYAQSKLANAYFGAELDRRLRAQGSPAQSLLAHPGVPATSMQQKAPGAIGVVVRLAATLVGKPPAHGAAAVMEAALAPDLAGGELLGPGRRLGEPPQRERAWPSLNELDGAAQLWERSEALVQHRFVPR